MCGPIAMQTARPLVCATVTRTRHGGAPRAPGCRDRGGPGRGAARHGAETPDAEAAIAGRRLPVVVTCRRQDEGGWFRGQRAGAARAALAGARRRRGLRGPRVARRVRRRRSAARRGRNIVLSLHDFAGVPADLDGPRATRWRRSSPEVVKVAVTVVAPRRMRAPRGLARRHAGRRMVLIAMGEAGLADAALSAARFGIAAGPTRATAWRPGQIDRRAHGCGEFRFRRIGPDTRPLRRRRAARSRTPLSPAMHNAAFDVARHRRGLRAAGGRRLRRLFDGMPRRSVLAGASVTAPFKVA